jgi:hypothetical protein
MRNCFLACALFVALFAAGCHKETKGNHDLSEIESKVKFGMTELAVVTQVGPPEKIESQGDYRNLYYYDSQGGYIEVTLRNNIVVDVSRRD